MQDRAKGFFERGDGGAEGEGTWKRGDSRAEARNPESGFEAYILKLSDGSQLLLGRR